MQRNYLGDGASKPANKRKNLQVHIRESAAYNSLVVQKELEAKSEHAALINCW
jgi:hypothetical protein